MRCEVAGQVENRFMAFASGGIGGERREASG
jgi:hypothetical protein